MSPSKSATTEESMNSAEPNPELQQSATPAELRARYPQLFAGPHGGERLLKRVIYSAVGGVAVVATGIFALRARTEGVLPGACFGAFALALGLASLINAFDVSDDVGELLDNLRQDTQKSAKAAQKAREEPVIKSYDAAAATASNIRSSYEAAGAAAAAGIRRLKFQALVNSPGVAGHGVELAPHPANQLPAPENASNGHHPEREVPRPAESAPEAD